MTTLKVILLLFLSIAFYSCGQNKYYSKVDVNVTRLSNKIISLVNHVDNPDSCKKALLFLDSATAIDNNCFLCYYNKLMFLSALRQYNRLFSTIDTCIKLRPDAIADNIYTTNEIEKLLQEIKQAETDKAIFRKSEDLFAIRQFLKEAPQTINIIFNQNLKAV